MSNEATKDEEFGPMTFDGSDWVLERRVEFNQAQLPIRIEPENFETREISDVQRDAVRHALNLPSDVLELSAPAVLQNYEVYREAIGDEEMPPLENPVEVWQHVGVSEIAVPPHHELTNATFMLNAECDWDPEHGLEVRFVNGMADAASQQGDLDLED